MPCYCTIAHNTLIFTSAHFAKRDLFLIVPTWLATGLTTTSPYSALWTSLETLKDTSIPRYIDTLNEQCKRCGLDFPKRRTHIYSPETNSLSSTTTASAFNLPPLRKELWGDFGITIKATFQAVSRTGRTELIESTTISTVRSISDSGMRFAFRRGGR